MKSLLGGITVVAIGLLAPASALANTADLSISAVDAPDPVRQGAVLTYTLTVRNAGPETAHGITVTNGVSSQVAFGSASSTHGTCALDGKVRCVIGQMDNGETATITITVTPTKSGRVRTRAHVGIDQRDTDPHPSNNRDKYATTVLETGGGGGASDISFGKVKKNKRTGTATLTVNVPGPGELDLARTNKVKPDQETAEDAGKVKLAIKPRGKAKKRLNDKGKAKVRAKVSYTPDTGGSTNTEDKRIKLVKR
jgi:uncharacterized repeat protein (TIGR01451 family)